MRTLRLATCATTAATLVLVPAAGAGKVCNLVVDVENDQRDANVTGTAHTPAADLDLVGGDVASNDEYVTAVFRLAALRERDGEPGAGGQYTVRFRVGTGRAGHRALVVTYGADGQDAWTEGHDHQGWIGPAYAEISHDRREIRVSASTSLLGVRKGRKLVDIEMTAAENWGLSGNYDPARPVLGNPHGPAPIVDRGEAKGPYVAGTPSCVVPRR